MARGKPWHPSLNYLFHIPDILNGLINEVPWDILGQMDFADWLGDKTPQIGYVRRPGFSGGVLRSRLSIKRRLSSLLGFLGRLQRSILQSNQLCQLMMMRNYTSCLGDLGAACGLWSSHWAMRCLLEKAQCPTQLSASLRAMSAAFLVLFHHPKSFSTNPFENQRLEDMLG